MVVAAESRFGAWESSDAAEIRRKGSRRVAGELRAEQSLGAREGRGLLVVVVVGLGVAVVVVSVAAGFADEG